MPINQVAEEKLLYTVAEATAMLSIGRTTLYERLAAGDIKPVRIGRCIRISASELTRFVAALAEEGAA